MTDRAVNDPVVTQHVRLGGYEDVAPITHSEATGQLVQEPTKHMLLETYNFNNALDREFVVGSFTWSTASATNQNMLTVDFPNALFTQQFIADKIKDHAFFRCKGIRISVRIAASKFCYGKLLGVWNPIDYLDIAAASLTNCFKASGNPHILISATASEAAVFDVPFLISGRAMDKRAGTLAASEIGTFRLNVLNPLYDVTAATSTAQVIVTASFIEAEVFMPESEAVKKGEKGVISGVLETADTALSVIEQLPFVNNYATCVRKILRPVRKAANALGLDMPTTIQVGQITKIDHFADQTAGKGIYLCRKIAIDPENAITTSPVVGGDPVDEMDMLHIISTPALVNIVNLTSASTTAAITHCSPGYASHDSFLDCMAYNFQYWSGSIKYKIYITASLMHAVRIVFYVSDNATTNDWQYCYHRVIDVQGDGEVDFIVPYMYPEAMSALFVPDTNTFYLRYKVLSWSQTDNALTLPVALNVYKAAGPDFQFAVETDVSFFPESCPRSDFQKDFTPIHPSAKAYNHSALVIGEKIETLRDIVHRMHPYYSQAAATNEVYLKRNYIGAVSQERTGIEKYAQFYRFWRGSIRVRLMAKTTTQNTDGVHLIAGGVRYAGNVIAGLGNPAIDFEVPHYYSGYFNHCVGSAASSLNWISSVKTGRFIFKAAGDDFSYHFLKLPYAGTFAPAVAVGDNQLITWLNT
jgi:hypothetical protein